MNRWEEFHNFEKTLILSLKIVKSKRRLNYEKR